VFTDSQFSAKEASPVFSTLANRDSAISLFPAETASFDVFWGSEAIVFLGSFSQHRKFQGTRS
jgi:hypothetical protein